MAQVEIDLSNNSTAKEYLTKAISILESKDGELPFLRNLAIAQAVMAKMYFNEGEFVNCLEARAKCLSILTGETDFSIAKDSIPEVVLDQSLLVELLIEFISEMSAPTSNSNESFQDSFDHFARLFDESIDLLVGGHQSDQSKLTWRNYVKDGYFKLSDSYLNSNRLKEAFHFAEKSRAILLYDRVVAEIDNNDQSELKQLLLKAEVDWFFERDTTLKSSHRRKLDSLNDLFRESNYSKLKPNASRSYDYGDLKKFQTSLGQKQNAIYFISGNGKTWILRISRDNIVSNFISHDEVGILDYNLFLGKLRSSSAGTSDPEYPEMINSIVKEIHFMPEKEGILIIPDGIWNYLPFESLIVDDHHLLSRNSVSYNYSASLSYLDRPKPGRAKILALAPFSNFQFEGIKNEFSFDQLEYTRNELNGIKTRFDVEALIGNSANLRELQNRKKVNSILHLATHAFGNDSSGFGSYLVLANTDSIEIISHEQIENMNLPLEMTVLSACETGLGQLNKGEGLMSLARGFFAAGSKSVITSLWKADDESTYKIMTAFYKYLARGQRKDEALRNAKLEYLENCDPLKSSPFYWAAFIPIGDMSPIRPVPWHLRWWFWPCIILIIGGTAGYGYQRSRKRRAA